MRLKIGGVWWTVEEVVPEMMNDVDGEMLGQACTIRLNKALCPERNPTSEVPCFFISTAVFTAFLAP